MEEPVRPVADVDVPPVPRVVAEVPPAAADPPVPPVMLVCAQSGDAVTSSSPSVEVAMNAFIFNSLRLWR